MKTVPVKGTGETITFFEDDTIETVRQMVALASNSHPDRLFLQVRGSFPKEYYANNPKRWTDLFFRMSYDGKVIPLDVMQTYLNYVRVGTGMTAQEVTLDEWERREEFLAPLYDPPTDFEELRILGVEEAKSFVMPIPPKDIPLPPARIPQVQPQSLYETFHPYEVTEIVGGEYETTMTELIKRNYFPRFKPSTPNNIESLRGSLQSSQAQYKALLDLDTPKHETAAIVRVKWYIPLISTRIQAPRARFEQIFYGMTVSKDTPYIGYFTAKSETLRHKFYVEDPKVKEPFVDKVMWRGWISNTQPQRRMPTLLLYRGTARNSFDRIAVTEKDITVSCFRSKTSTETLEDLKTSLDTWLRSLDALMPFVVQSDLDKTRWDLGDLSAVATYPSEIREEDIDMHRFPCLQTIFGYQNETFRLLRSEHSSDDISPLEIQAIQALSQEGADASPEYLAAELNISQPEASELLASVQARSEDIDIEKSLRAYPTLKFGSKEVVIKFVTDLDRTLKYADILRFVLTSNSEAVNQVCPRRMDKVAPKVTVPQQELDVDAEYNPDEELNALLGLTEEEEVVPEQAEAPPTASAPKPRKVKLAQKSNRTYNYFNNRLQKFDPSTFDKTLYPSSCEKLKQVVVLSPEDQTRVGPNYNYAEAPEAEKLPLEDPEGLAICPAYWCMRDEIPLREDQLVTGEDGELHCPVCDGKVRPNDNVDTIEYSVIKRNTLAKFPDLMSNESGINQRKMPCCYQKARSSTAVLGSKEDETYILREDVAVIPGLRMAYLSSKLVEVLGVTPEYDTSTKKGRLLSGKGDVFRVGLGRPAKTLPVLFGDRTPILRPKDPAARENLMRCSFVRTWRGGGADIEKVIADIDATYQRGEMNLMDELEYVTTFLRCEVILVDTESNQVACGFWSDSVGANSRTIAILGQDILANVSRKKEGSKAYKTIYDADLRNASFTATLAKLRELHAKACSVDVPVLKDALAELRAKGKADYHVIQDPFRRIQAVFIPREVILPIQPFNGDAYPGAVVHRGYFDIPETDLPTGANERAFLGDTRHPKYKIRDSGNLQDVNGRTVELMLESGFRVPIQPEESPKKEAAREVWQTAMKREGDLVDAPPNADDVKLAEQISYEAEVYEFLMFSLSKNVAVDENGDIIEPMYGNLRNAIASRSDNLLKELKTWFKHNAYEDTTKSPVEFVNKVRTPCGQYTQKDACNKSSLCGWHKSSCKIRVKPIVEKDKVLARIAKTLRNNDKQRALVLDERLSPFFSTILYMEMPHEWITTVV